MNTASEQHFYSNEISLNFNLRTPKADKPTPIYAVVRINSTQIKIPMGVRVYPKHWSKERQEAMVSASLGASENKANRIANKKIIAMKFGFSEFLQYVIDNDVEDSELVTILKDRYKIRNNMTRIKNALLDLGRLVEDKEMSEDSKRQYRATLKSFEDFLQETKGRKILEWGELTLSLLNEYKTWFSQQVQVHKITKERVRIEDNTVRAKMTYLYTILTYAEQAELIDLEKTRICKFKDTSSKTHKSEDNQIYITDEEVNRIFNLRLEGKEQQVRDLFLFQLEVGQRYSDINGLEVPAVSKDITIIQKKTRKQIDIRLTDTAYNILSRYRFHLPSITNADSNKLLKEIARKAQITRSVEVCEMRGGQQYRFTVEAWKLIGTHTARRSFISNCLLKGIDGEILKKQTGHSTNSAFTRYNRIGSKEASERIAAVMDGKQHPSQTTPIPIVETSQRNELREEIRHSLNLEAAIQQNEKAIRSLRHTAAIEQSFVEDEKRKRLTLEEAYHQGIPYELFKQIQSEQDEISDKMQLSDYI